MKPGPRRLPPSIKRAQNTYRASRDEGIVEVEVPPGVPQKPDWLSSGASAIWDEMVEHLVNSRLAAEPDGLLLAQLSSLHAACIAAWSSGTSPPISAITEIRRLSELFGLSGPRSRVLKMSAPREINPFLTNGRRPGAGD